MGRDQEYIWLGLAKALESGMGTFLRRTERQETQQLREKAFKQREEGVQGRHEERQAMQLLMQKLRDESADAKERKKREPVTHEEDFWGDLGYTGAGEKVRSAIKGSGGDLMSEDPMEVQRILDTLKEQNPTEELPPYNRVKRREELMAGGMEGRKTSDVLDMEADAYTKKEREARSGRTRTLKGAGRLEERIRRLKKKRADAPFVPQGPPPPPGYQHQQGGMGQSPIEQLESGPPVLDDMKDNLEKLKALMGGDMGMQQQQPMGLDPGQFQGLPQGDNVTPQDQAQLGQLARHFNTIMGLTPGGATMTELAEAHQWWAQNSPVAKLPMDIELFASGVPGQPPAGGPSIMQDLVG